MKTYNIIYNIMEQVIPTNIENLKKYFPGYIINIY